MRAEPVEGDDPRAVLRGLRGAVLGAGPAITLGGGVPAGEVPSGTAVIVTTSGSTGHPKSVVLSRSALTSSALATADRIGSGAWLLALPAGYIAGVQVLVRALVSGREPAILAGSFSAHAFAAAAGAMASSDGGAAVPMYTSLVPAQLQTLLDAEDDGVRTGLRRFEAVLVGGQALAAPLAERAQAAGVRVVRTYGASETSGGCVYDGVPLDGVAVRIDDGEVQVAGPVLAEGYLGEPERTAAAFVHDAAGRRWYRTGDLGTFDGVLRVTGRRDNVIVSGGVNVSLDRVERLVRTLPGLSGAVVVAVADERWGEASVIAVPAADLAGTDVVALLREVRSAVGEALGAPARPRAILPVPAIPLLPSGKPDRAALRAAAARAAV
ncbi:AMP-binding protein [Microbacterium sp. T2.11-28]|uniref:AMP-binding protein n=1 Tax=Microbacterium sp. T2.11-28 TaxID=3041169 RepID=UPI00247769A2|nr:AMP-binding protein [Microbacterium sp. T2.11-28]CAI9393456.1 putative 2-succinylbenzoate--CoA ligase [Microbacterium sp. T2.11-28]